MIATGPYTLGPALAKTTAAIYIPACLTQLDVDPFDFFSRVLPGLPYTNIHDLSLCDLSYLLDAAAAETRCDCFGLMVGLCGSSHLLENELPVRHGSALSGAQLKHAIEELVSQIPGLLVDIARADEDTSLRCMIIDPSVTSGEQVMDLYIATLYKALRDIFGPAWKPTEIRLSRRAPANTQPFLSAFSAPVIFNSPLAALHFSSRWMTFVAQQPALLSADPVGTLSYKVASMCLTRYVDGKPVSSDAIADLLGLSRRTMHRRLSAQGTTYKEIVNEARYGAAIRLLHDTNLTMTEIGLHLGYSELSAFTRAFHGWAGAPPSRIRKQDAQPQGASQSQDDSE